MWIARVLTGAVLGVAAAFTAHAQSPWYVSGSIGGYWREDQGGPTRFTNGVITGPGKQTESFDPGPTASAAIGYKLPFRLRLEAEASYIHYTADHVNPLSATFPTLNGRAFNLQSGGDYDRYMATANLFYDLPITIAGRIVPYIGGGMGYVHAHQADSKFVSAAGSLFTMHTQSNNSHAVALIEGGLTIPLGGAWALVPAYRYEHLFTDANIFGDENAHILKLGVRYSFQ